jgi:nitroreductase
MDIQEAIRERKSIRRFRPDEIPPEVIQETLEEARWPSSWFYAPG